jgi:4-diphosphocytidyl-2-C-methyl-D-erythritol kinase
MERSFLTSFAYAKINLALAITGVREDGYHELQSVMQSIELHDVVKVRYRGEKIVCHCGELSGPENLAYKAAVLFQRQYGQFQGIEIEIEKNIPIQAGLAGGSTDAAATLRLLNELYGNPYDNKTLLALAAKLGADVAFCLNGGTMWASGRGDSLELLPSTPQIDLILVKPFEGVDTKQAYLRFDEVGHYGILSHTDWERALSQKLVRRIGNLLYNDLEAASIQLVPQILELKKLLLEAECYGALMSGSGSCVFGIAGSKQHAIKTAGRLKEIGYSNVWVTRTVNGKTFERRETGGEAFFTGNT